MTRPAIQEQWLAESRADSRNLALEAGSAISTNLANSLLVLGCTQPVAEFLLGGDTDDLADLLARRRAVRRHLQNIARTPACHAGDPEVFLQQVRPYYEYLVPPPPSAEAQDAGSAQ
jgi:hypothetical protein